MKHMLLGAFVSFLLIAFTQPAQAWLSYLDGSSLPQSNGWLLDASDAGALESLGSGNSGIRQSDDTADGYDEWYIVNTNQASTLAARFKIDFYGGGPANLLQLSGHNTAANPSPLLAIGIRDGRFYLIRVLADNAGAPTADARLADLGAVQETIFNEAYLHIDAATGRVRLFWNGGLRYSGVETNASYLFGAGQGFAEFGASNYYPDQDRSAVVTIVYDWVGYGDASDLPLNLPFIAWQEYLDGSTPPAAPWQPFTDPPGSGTTSIAGFTDPFNGGTNEAIRITSNAGANEWYIGPVFEDETFGGGRFAIQEFSATGKENLFCVTTVANETSMTAPCPAITLVDGRYKLLSYVNTGAELLDIGPVVTNEFHTVYLYAHKNGRVKLWWDGNLIYDAIAPLDNPYNGYFEWGSGSWQFDASDTVDFDWVAFGLLTSAPSLTTTPANNAAFQDATAGFNFTIASESGVGTNGVAITVNGVDRTSALVLSGTDNSRQGSLGGFVANQIYKVVLVFTTLSGDNFTNTVVFDTFSQGNLMIEAEDWNFEGGRFIDNPVPASMEQTNSYFGRLGYPNIDEHELSTEYEASRHEYRDLDLVGTERTGDFLRQKYIDAQVSDPAVADYNVGWVEITEWLNYTRTFPAGSYHVYGRFANGNIGQFFEAGFDKVADATTETQVLTPVGSFRGGPGRGWQNYEFVPLTDAQTNIMTVSFSGVETFRVTAVAGGYNANFYMLVPAAPPAPRLNITRDGTEIVVTWTGSGYTLQRSSAISGPWESVSTTANSYRFTPGAAPQFFRLRQ